MPGGDLVGGLELWVQGVPTAEIADRFGTTPHHVRNVAHRQGWPKRRPTGGHNGLPVERDEARRLWHRGFSVKAIALHCDVSANTVIHWRWKHGWPKRDRYHKRPIRTRQVTHQRDAHGEKASLPPGRLTYACPVCGCRSDSPSGHPTCTHGRAA